MHGRVGVSVDYSTFKDAFGGNWASRLHLVELPACALTTPKTPACRIQTPLASTNAAAAGTVTADVTLGQSAPAAHASTSHAASPMAAAGASAMVLAATSNNSSGAGDYSATGLNPSGSWNAGGSSGDYTYDYPISVPPAAGGLMPTVGLSYDSQSLDGRLSSTNSQASWIGDGWDYAPGAVTRSYVSCSDDPVGTAPKVQDQCWAGQVLHVSFGSHSGDIVQDSSTPTGWRLSSDDNEKVELVTGGTNGTYDGDYWKITTTDGAQYFFGLNHLPGWSSGKATTNSAWTEPVYGAHSGDPCYDATFANASCSQAYQWNLDYVVDTRGNAMAYYYNTETNYYGADNGTTGVPYVRGGYLDHIDYGFTNNNAYAASAPQRVQFTTSDRCVATTCDPIASNKANWPDVPFDLNCDSGASCSNHGPSFWTERRLTSIATEIYQGSAYSLVDTYALAQSFPDPGDGTSPALWLDSITHTANVGTAITLPPVTFAGEKLVNRYNTGNGYPDLVRYRVSGITTETGEQIQIAYSSPSCTPVSDPSTNTSLCFPVYWTPWGQSTPVLDWFNKYLVTSVTRNDTTGGGSQVVTSYNYTGTPAWHYDDNEVVKAKYRTWGQWRGYSRVETLNGSTADGQTRTDTIYYQGMYGDTLPGGKSRTTTVGLDSNITVPGAAASVADTQQLQGRPRESITYDGASGSPVQAAVYDYWVSPANATRTRTGLPALTANYVRPSATYATQAITSTSPTTWRSTETVQGYNLATGLLEYTDDHGDVSVPAQEACTSLFYAPANTSNNLSGLVDETETDQGPCASSGTYSSDSAGFAYPSSDARPAAVIVDKRTYYDTTAPTTWPPSVPTGRQTTTPGIGLATLTEQASDFSTANSAFTYQITGATAFDSYGRPTDAWDALGNKTHTAYTTTNGLTTQTAVTNAKNQTITNTLEPTRGLTTTIVDANSSRTDSTFDALGRVTAVWLPNRSKSSGQSADFTYAYAVSATTPSAVTTNSLLESGAYKTSIDIFDALLRSRQTQDATPAGGRLLTDEFYNSRGQAYKVNNPYLDGSNTPSTSLDTATTDNLVPNQDDYTYDAQGRQVLDTSMHLNIAVPGQTTRTVYGGDRTTVIPPTGGTTMTTVTDARGRTTEVDHYLTAPTVSGDQVSGGTHTTISYVYDATGSHGQMTEIDGPNSGVKSTYAYNLLGQRTGSTDPDTGTSQIFYDADGNVTKTVDADQNTLSYAYDALGRKTFEYNGPTSSSPKLASWTYDATGVTDSIGHETSSTRYDSSGNQFTESTTGFNAMGQPTGASVSIPTSVPGLGSSTAYAYSYTYSATTGLPQTINYPAAGSLPAETVTTGYTSFDLPNSVGGLNTYALGTTYDAYSRVLKATLGFRANTAALNYSYDDHTGAVTEVNTQRTTAPATVDDIKYAYDPAGNLASSSDAQNSGAVTDTQCFQYDGLDRLAQAWTASTGSTCSATPTNVGPNPTVGGVNPYWNEWQYDNAGNRQQQTQHAVGGATGDTTTSYTYGLATDPTKQPDTLSSTTTTLPDGTKVGGLYATDNAGNTTSTTNTPGTDTLKWDPEGKLQSVQSTGQTNPTTYLYDADGNQLMRTDPTGTVTVFLPGQAISYNGTSVSGIRSIALPDGTTATRYASGTGYAFICNNYQGTGTLSLDSTAQTPTFRSYDPYGNPRGAAPTTWHSDQGYVGGTQDPNTSLTNLGAREYLPALGRFLSADPVLETTDPNQIGGYTYAGDNPVTHADPTGLNIPVETSGPTGCLGPVYAPGCQPPACVPAWICTPPGGGGDDGSGNGDGNGGGSGDGRSGPTSTPTSGAKTCGDFDLSCQASHLWAKHKAELIGLTANGATWTLCMGIAGANAEDGAGEVLATRCGAFAGAIGNLAQNAADPNADHSKLGSLETAAIGALLGGSLAKLGYKIGAWLIARYGDTVLADLGRLLTGDGGGSCQLNSFVGTTQVLLADGKTKPIQSVHIGDTVLASDPVTGTTKAEAVTNVITTLTDKDFTDVTVHTTAGNRKITSTQHHPYWDSTAHRWVNAGDLSAGDELRTADGLPAKVVAVRSYRASVTTYNLTVGRLHTYYVLAGATPVLVHNSSSCPTGRLSDPLPRGMNNKIAAAYDLVKSGQLTSHDIYSGREYPWWAGSEEYRVPGRPDSDRILVKTLPNGDRVFGWTTTHYQKIQKFSAPQFPDSGW